MASKPAAKKPAPPKSTAKKPAAARKRAGIDAPEQAVPATATPDWERIELDYRAGIKTLRQIAGEHGISHVAVNKRAKKDGWERDLAAKIQAKADALVTKSLVTTPVTKERQMAEKAVVDANAQAVADVRLAHRADIHRARRITNALLQELEQQTEPQVLALLKQLGEMLRNEDERGIDRRNDLYQAVISLPERSKTMKTLAESLRVLVDMERTAFGMGKDSGQAADALGALLHTICTGNSSAFMPVANDPERVSGFMPVVGPDDGDD